MTEDKLRKVNKEKPGIQNVVIKGAERDRRNIRKILRINQ